MNRQARVEFGEALASNLKLSKDGSMVLWPQPSDDPNDPQNVRVLLNINVLVQIMIIIFMVYQWSDQRKALHLLIITMAAFVPDFDSAIGR